MFSGQTIIGGGQPRCAECAEQGVTPEKVFQLAQQQSMDGASLFFDRLGHQHYHQPNPVVTVYECSSGHRWTVEVQPIGCHACGRQQISWDDARYIGLAGPAQIGVYDSDGRLLGISFSMEGDPRHLMIPVEVAPADAISLAWPPT